MLVGAFGILCGFALVVFAAASRPGVTGISIACVAAALTWTLLPAGSLPDPVWGASVVLAVASLMLWSPRSAAVAPAAAGVAGTLWMLLLVGQGLPLVASAPVVLAVAVGVFVLRWRSTRFAPPALVEEALLICAVLAVLVACGPAVSSGYRSAMVFTAERVSSPPALSAPWALQLSTGLLVLGGLYSFWRRR